MSEEHLLESGSVVLYTWENPAGPRELIWSCGEAKDNRNPLDQVRVSVFIKCLLIAWHVINTFDRLIKDPCTWLVWSAMVDVDSTSLTSQVGCLGLRLGGCQPSNRDKRRGICTLMRPIVTDQVAWSVCRFVCHSHDPCTNGWTDWNAIWVVDSRNNVLDGVQIPVERGNFYWGIRVTHCKV